MTNWEYKVVKVTDRSRGLESLEAALNVFGSEGWELLAFFPASCAIFKRKKE